MKDFLIILLLLAIFAVVGYFTNFGVGAVVAIVCGVTIALYERTAR